MIIEFPSTSRMRALVEARAPHAQALMQAAVIASMNGARNADQLLAAAHTAYAELTSDEKQQIHPVAPAANLVPLAVAGLELGKEILKLLKK